MSIDKLRKILNENESTVSLPISELRNLIEGFREKTVQVDDIINYLSVRVNQVLQDNHEKEQQRRDDYNNFQTIRGQGKQVIINILKEHGFDPETNEVARNIVQHFVHNYEGDAAEALENMDKIFKEGTIGRRILDKLKPRLAPHKWKAPHPEQ